MSSACRFAVLVAVTVLALQGCQNHPVEGLPPSGPADAGTTDHPGHEPVPTSAALTKVKNLLVGLPATDAEIAQVTQDQSTLPTLVAQWMTLPEYDAKMQAFFATAFQQTQLSQADLGPQFNQDIPFTRKSAQILENYEQSFARTTVELVAEEQPFTATMTTQRFMMTPALMAAYALIDAVPVNDAGKATDVFARQHPTAITLESSQPIPIEQAIDPTNANYMHFYHPGIATSFDPACPSGTLTYTSPASTRVLASIVLSQSPFNFNYMGHRCSPPAIPDSAAYVVPSDFTDWKMVTIRAPQPGEATTAFYDLPTLRTTTELVLNVPRQGFFSTPSFFGQWATNRSNLARVTLNQTVIVGLGEPMDLSNETHPASVDALDQNHAAPGTECYSCHLSLDPMRQFFRQAYSLNFSAQSDTAEQALPGQFAFHGVSATGTGIFDLGAELAGHPYFATAWVQRLCTYANSSACDETDPEFLRLVSVFTQSNYSWNALVQALFSSPIVTYLQKTQTADQLGETFPMARQQHLCATLSARLGIDDVCGLKPGTAGTGLKLVQTIASSWPSDQYSRGDPAPVLANSPSLFMRTGMENICSKLADYLIDNTTTGQYQSTDPTGAIQSFATRVMGLSTDRSAGPISILQSHYDAALQTGAKPRDALKSTFVLACLSPYVVGIGQ